MKLVIALVFVCGSVFAVCTPTPLPFVDNFSSTELDSCWQWVREDASLWSLTEQPGALLLRTNGNFHQPQTNSTRSIPLRAFTDQNMFIETKLDFAIDNCSGAGLMFYKDDDNFVDIMVIEEAEPDVQGIVSHNDINNVHDGRNGQFLDWNPVFLRILKSGNNYTAFASPDSTSWVVIAEWINDLAVDGTIRAGLYAIDCDRNIYHPAKFDYFRADTEENLPVELLSFTATPSNNRVTLNWSTGSESNVSHFEIDRDGATLARVEAANQSSGHAYTWLDDDVTNGQSYNYTLTSVDLDGSRVVHGTVEATPHEAALPTELTLLQNYPNPFNASTTIEYSLPEATNISLKLFNLAGQEVAVLANGAHAAGRHVVSLNASDLSSGIYFYRLESPMRSVQQKMVLLK